MGNREQRIAELTELAAVEGFTLPFDASWIVTLENAGNVVDLVTGQIITDGANMRIEPTVIGEATMVALGADNVGT